MTEQTPERRRFSRIPFEALAQLRSQHGIIYNDCVVHDVSLKGLLISRPPDWQGQQGEPYLIDLHLENTDVIIKMSASVAHIAKDSIGFDCLEIDLDSITHLKRLIELNLGDEALLHRELHALIEQH